MLSVSASFHRSPAMGLRSLLSSRIQSQALLPEISCQKNVRLQRNGAISPAHSDADIVKASLAVDTKVRSEESQKISPLTSTTTPCPARLSSPRGGTWSIIPVVIHSINPPRAPATWHTRYHQHPQPHTCRKNEQVSKFTSVVARRFL